MAKRKETSAEAPTTIKKQKKDTLKPKTFEKKSKAPPALEKKAEAEAPTSTSLKKQKKDSPKPKTFEKKSKAPPTVEKKGAPKTFPKKIELTEKPEDWNKFKKEKKELKLKRKQSKYGFDIIVQAKKIGEKLRCKTLKGGEIERNKLINELHSLLKDKDNYSKFVLAHDTSRVVQWLLKYSSDIVKEQISKELIPHAVTMIQSKYGIFCIKRLLKYGSASTKSAIVGKMYGHAVKFTSHSLSGPVFEYAFTTCATPLQKSHLIQEFYGDMYKNSKDDKIKHLSDVFETSPDLKAATLGATKANLLRVINKNLLDSTLVQSVLLHFLSTCSDEDKSEIIQLITPHIVVISNSRDGAKAAMLSIWQGSNKERKLAMKALKEHVVDMCKHEHAHASIITMIDTADDTVLLQKVLLGEILKNAKLLAKDEWARKVLMWLVAPGDQKCFHPLFVKELDAGREKSTAKKDAATRRSEILAHAQPVLLEMIKAEPEFWMENSSVAYLTLAIVKSVSEESALFREVLEGLVSVIVREDWSVDVDGKVIKGIEDAGMHLILKKLAQNDTKLDGITFGRCLSEGLSKSVLKMWVQTNRGCFVLIAALENNKEEVQEMLKVKLEEVRGVVKKQSTAGSRILLGKM